MKPFRFLLIDDDLFYCKSLQKYFESNSLIEITAYFHQGELVDQQMLAPINFNYILLDMNMPSKNGLQMMQSFLDWHIHIPVFVCTSYLNKEYIEQFYLLGVKHCIKKEIPQKLELTLLSILNPISKKELRIQEKETVLGGG